MKIFIPSYKRSDKILLPTKTLAFMSAESLKETTVVVREEEEALYRRVLSGIPVQVMAIPTSLITATELAKGRQFMWVDTMDYILDHACNTALYDRIAIMDDDLTMSYRQSLVVGSPKAMTNDQWDKMMWALSYANEETPLTSAMFRGFCSSKVHEYNEDVPINGIFCMYLPVFRARPDLRFCNTEAIHMPDRAIVLRLLKNGYHTREYCRFCYNDVANTSGGCSMNRTAEGHSDSARALMKEHPDVVKLTVKTNLGDTRIATIVQWKKAYRERTA